MRQKNLQMVRTLAAHSEGRRQRRGSRCMDAQPTQKTHTTKIENRLLAQRKCQHSFFFVDPCHFLARKSCSYRYRPGLMRPSPPFLLRPFRMLVSAFPAWPTVSAAPRGLSLSALPNASSGTQEPTSCGRECMEERRQDGAHGLLGPRLSLAPLIPSALTAL